MAGTVIDLAFTIPGLPPSINSYWKSARGMFRPYISKEGIAYRQIVGFHIKRELVRRKQFIMIFPKELPISVEIKLFSPRFWTDPKKKGEKPRPSQTGGDIDNFVKILLDCSSKVLGFNDAQIMRQHVEKLDSEKEETYMRIWVEA